MTISACLSCGGDDILDVVALDNVPVLCNALAADEVAARAAPTGDIDLVFCATCGLLYNRAFDPKRMAYAASYENALHHSPSFQAFAKDLAQNLVREHGLKGKAVAEIGCGDGYMLSLMRAEGVGQAIGFDPSMEGRENIYQGEGVEIVPAYFDPKHLEGEFSAVLCRHVLEHLDDPLGVLKHIRGQIGDREDVAVYFEVPNAEWLLRSVSIWDVIYEHVSYWTAPAIETLFRRAGFEPQWIGSGYGDQFLQIVAKPAAAEPDFVPNNVAEVRELALAFRDKSNEMIAAWRERLAAHSGRTILWGAGSKGISFASVLGGSSAQVTAMIDLNPRKHGMHVPVSAVPVVSPTAVPDLAPDLVLISNGLYENEIREEMRRFGLSPDFGIITR